MHQPPTQSGLLPGALRSVVSDLSIERGDNDLLVATDGREFIDLFTGCGTVFMGHRHSEITALLHTQLNAVWNIGSIHHPMRDAASSMIEGFFPEAYRNAAMYTTGMEAAEFAMRVARIATGRKAFLGFQGCMHGKSTATAYLGWDNSRVSLPGFIRLPYVSTHAETDILDSLDQELSGKSVAAVFVEPLQGSAGGHLASDGFYRSVAELTQSHGSLLVVDEIFSGFYRTGRPFLYEQFGIAPDIVLVGKAMGNGFPVSAVVVNRKHEIRTEMLPASTFAGNPLGAAAVVGTLTAMKKQDLEPAVARIDTTMRALLAPLAEFGVVVRGRGALWILEVPRRFIDPALARIVSGGVIVGPTASYFRLLPPVTILPDHLRRACTVVHGAFEAVASG